MRIIKPSIKFNWITPDALKEIEHAGRKSRLSEATNGSAKDFVKKLLDNKHFSVTEHACISYDIVCDIGTAKQITRHRFFSVTQESTIHATYNKELTIIEPPLEPIFSFAPDYEMERDRKVNRDMWVWTMEKIEQAYFFMLGNNEGRDKEQARSILPHCLKTELTVTSNLREMMHFFSVRTCKGNELAMIEIANMLLEDIKKRIEIIFDKIIEC